MLKRICTKKIIISSIVLLIIGVLYCIPSQKESIRKEVSYVNYDLKTNEVYLLDKNNYVSRVKIATDSEDEELVDEIVNILICNGDGEDKIPNGFKCTINEKTKINSINIKDTLLKIDLSKELLETDKELEEKVLESLIYSLTGIENINSVILYLDGDILTTLPQKQIHLPSTLTRDFGINKKYELTDSKDIKKTTIYYVNKQDDNIYYTPITLVNNDPREKIEIIIDELSNKILGDNLASYMNNNTKVLKSEVKDKTLAINFNENILSDFDNRSILEEVIYTVALSANDNYVIDNVFFNVNDQEIAKTTIKSLE